MLKYLFLDIDGTFTDGGVYYDDNNNEIKKFCTKDGTGIICARAAGIKTVVITGRESKATTRRMTELKVDYIFQNVKDKVALLQSFMAENYISTTDAGYIGDDINDLAPMKLCGFVGCPGDSCQEVKKLANYISPINGGYGAVRDIIEKILKDEGVWKEIVNKAYGTGV